MHILMYIYTVCVVHTKGREMPAIGKSEDQLRHVLSPLYMQLFNLIGQLEFGVKFLVDLRADLLVSYIYILCSTYKCVHR